VEHATLNNRTLHRQDALVDFVERKKTRQILASNIFRKILKPPSTVGAPSFNEFVIWDIPKYGRESIEF
jgi:hypothetical protein